MGVHERADVLEQALAQLGVVGVDLARTLGAVQDQLVLAVGLGEQVVDGGVGHALSGDVRKRYGCLFLHAFVHLLVLLAQFERRSH